MRTLVLLATLAAAGAAQAQEGTPPHPFGLGLMLGEPIGLSAKYYLGNKMALDAGLGESRSYWNHDGLHLHVDVLWHPKVLTRQPAFDMPFYLGVGGRLLDDDFIVCDGNGRNCVDYDDTQ